MKPLVSIIMGSTSDLPVMEKACKLLDELQVPFEVNALSAHRTPEAVESFARSAPGAWHPRHHCCGGYGCRPAWCHRGLYHVARHRCAHQGYARRSRCHALHHPDAPGHPCGYCGCQRCSERRHPRCRDVGSRR